MLSSIGYIGTRRTFFSRSRRGQYRHSHFFWRVKCTSPERVCSVIPPKPPSKIRTVRSLALKEGTCGQCLTRTIITSGTHRDTFG